MPRSGVLLVNNRRMTDNGLCFAALLTQERTGERETHTERETETVEKRPNFSLKKSFFENS